MQIVRLFFCWPRRSWVPLSPDAGDTESEANPGGDCGSRSRSCAGISASAPQHQKCRIGGRRRARYSASRQIMQRDHLLHNLVYTGTEKMLNEHLLDAVLVYNPIKDDRKVIEMAAAHGFSSMVEQPQSAAMDDAFAIRKAAREHHVLVLVNYEATWIHQWQSAEEAGDAKPGNVRKVTVQDGHESPKEIGVGPEWLSWLIDPVQAGAGALFDFNCYGADLIIVLMKGEAPLSMPATT
jgi:predicted dehydrogenase